MELARYRNAEKVGAASIHQSERICITFWMSQFPRKTAGGCGGGGRARLSGPEENGEAAS